MRVHYLTDSDRLRAMLPDELAIVEEAPGLSRVVLEWARSDGDGLGSYTQCLQVSAFCCDCCQLTICVFFSKSEIIKQFNFSLFVLTFLFKLIACASFDSRWNRSSFRTCCFQWLVGYNHLWSWSLGTCKNFYSIVLHIHITIKFTDKQKKIQ